MPRVHSVLITQCLQRDFVDLVPKDRPLPNKLHVGPEEAERLLGVDPSQGPVAQLMAWARAQQVDRLSIFHVRDWHDPADPRQSDHLAAFGTHCVKNTPGASLVLGLDSGMRANERTVDAIALNDCEDTRLPEVIEALAALGPLKVGVVGVWTEAKVSFLLYDLKTRFRIDALATCSALDASASRAQHFNALEQLKKLLGVEVFDGVGEFTDWLLPDGARPSLPKTASGYSPDLRLPAGASPLGADEKDILSWLYRDSARVDLAPLSGGFSGCRVFRAESHDSFGHDQAPSVAKIGPRRAISSERAAFERVEPILGNNAPGVRGFADLGDVAGIKYAFASMGRGRVRTLKSMFEANEPQRQIDAVLTEVFEEILGRFYTAATRERLSLYGHYGFDERWAPEVRQRVAALADASGPRIRVGSLEALNVCRFYEKLPPDDPGEYRLVSYVHGDLNGANVLVDSRDNVWLIDFFHTARGHVLKDLAKVENDLLYLFTPLPDEAALEEGLAITRALARVEDLREPLPETPSGVTLAPMRRAWATLITLRRVVGAVVKGDPGARQLDIALLRYSVHTLGFDEASPLQRRWALASSCLRAEKLLS